jgi:hypothetical protein
MTPRRRVALLDIWKLQAGPKCASVDSPVKARFEVKET